MAIQALPQTTIRTLGASQVLTDPTAVVKELLDNALDAHASSVAIEVHSNTLDSIQVRDNGYGVPPEDRSLVARPHCTSKIRSEDDLKDIGGSSLGFRGEALASVAEMSGSLTISTRIEGEQVATLLRISPQGEVVGEERASTPVGTTIKITDFMKSHPVRRQVALRSSEKTLKKIKQLLQAYAFARPHVRLSLRVLKAKNDRGNWLYAPKAGGNAEDAAFKVVGAPCASQCIWSITEEHGFSLHAFLPRLDAEPSKVNNMGVFVSVDGRPLAPSRGTPKQIVKHLKNALQTAGSNLQGCKDLFVHLEIQCPNGSYDANIEPAKDGVLFEDSDVVLNVAKKLFAAAYPPEAPAHEPTIQSETHQRTANDEYLSDHEKMLPALPSPANPMSGLGTKATRDPDRGMTGAGHEKNRPVFRSSMYGCDEEDLDIPDAGRSNEDVEAEAEELRQARTDVFISNPWVLAKLNASRRRPIDDGDNLPSPNVASQSMPRIDLRTGMLPTPRPSSPSLPHLPDELFANDGCIVGLPELPPTVQYSRSSPQDAMASLSSVPHQTSAYDYSLSSHSDPVGTPLSAIPQAGAGAGARSPIKRTKQSKINKPFKQPLRDHPEGEKVWFDHLEDIERPHPSRGKKRTSAYSNTAGLVFQGELGDFIDDPRSLTPPMRNRDMRDFVTPMDRQRADESVAAPIEHRNHAATSRARPVDRSRPNEQLGDRENTPNVPSFIRASEMTPTGEETNSQELISKRPSKQRRTADSRPLRELSANVPLANRDELESVANPAGGTTPGRRQATLTGRKPSRRKSSRLPLERTPAGQGTYSICIKMQPSMSSIAKLANSFSAKASVLNWDEPALDAYHTFATMEYTSTEVMTTLADTVRELLINRVSDREMVQDLRELVPAAFAAHEGGDDELVFQ